MRQAEREPRTVGAWTAAGVVIAISLLSTFTLADPNDDDLTADATGRSQIIELEPGQDPGDVEGALANDEAGGGGTSRRRGKGGPGTAGSEGGGDQGAGAGGAAGRDYDCSRGENAGNSDVGITGREIKLAATVVKTGIAKDFLADAQFGIEAVRQKVNRQGGICGRLLNVSYDDDEWKTDAGARIIQKWIGEKQHFALIVNPSSEGLRGAIEGGLIDPNEFPVVGADGMLIGQYKEDWVWPVATSTHSVMHIMAKDAWARGNARGIDKPTFGIVWENNYKFGEEGHDAFKGAIGRLCDSCLVADVGIKGGLLSYKNDADTFVGKCSESNQDFKKCDFVAVLLEPATAAQWVSDNGLGSGAADKRPAVGIGAPQPLFVNSFIRDCGAPCANMRVWTSFKPPLPPFDNDPAVATYLSDLRAVSTAADASNPHVQGAYVGAQLLVEALERLGPNPTRAGLKQALDEMTFDSKLAPPLTFRPGNHFAAVSAQAYEAVFNVNSFVSWRYTESGFISDDDVREDQREDE